MLKFIVAMMVVMGLAGCVVNPVKPPSEQIIKEKNVAVVLDDEFFTIPVRPMPDVSREEAKQMKPRDIITLQTEFIGTLFSHIKNLEVQITGIKSAQNKLASEIEKGNDQ